ncbi:hypothetical protein OC842_004198 [Tilletia horrida]|uniref:Uncharacterized protein n=1 Tax=Tilletia horrida TaxID=155126 RepID=A0AAN6GAA7_9BASI|nr:hypothetical protein OC842_004198 [Tilletia horrida]
MGRPGHLITFNAERSVEFGKLVVASKFDLPGQLGVSPRDPHLYRNIHYKMVEWIAVFHRYVGPYFHSHSHIDIVDVRVLDMHLALLDGIGYTLSEDGCRQADILRIGQAFEQFCLQWEVMSSGTMWLC